jgi:hypothetical protein
MVPLGAVLHNRTGSVGARQPAYPAMRSHVVVVVVPQPQHRAGVTERHEQRLVEAFVTQTAVEALDVAVMLRLARRDVVPLDRQDADAPAADSSCVPAKGAGMHDQGAVD